MVLSRSSLARILFLAIGLGLPAASTALAQTPAEDQSANDTWHVIGFNENRIAVQWVQHKSYEVLNENSFRMNAKYANEKGGQTVGRIDVNCKNKDYYFRPNGVFAQQGSWLAIPSGSGIYALAVTYCKRTSARADWGYTPATSYLWDSPPPVGDPANAKGEWIEAVNNDEVEIYYNKSILRQGDIILFANYTRLKKGERSAAQGGDTTVYAWVRGSCKENLASRFYVSDKSVEGVWLPPESGRPGGSLMVVKKLFC